MDLGVTGKRALICASSHGLGFATAHRLAMEGARVVVCGRGADTVEAARVRIAAEGGEAIGIVADLGDRAGRESLVAEVTRALGGIDMLLLNTGGPPMASVAALTLDQWQRAYETLVESVVHLSQLVLPGMAERKWGRVLAVTSFVTREPAGLMGLSNSLRAAVNGLMKTLASEYGPHGVTVNAILPGYILTDRLRSFAQTQAQAKGLPADRAFDSIAANVPLGRLGEPVEFGKVAAFLLSDAASYVTGTTITVDGGLARGVH